jgi:hypothetical protein
MIREISGSKNLHIHSRHDMNRPFLEIIDWIRTYPLRVFSAKWSSTGLTPGRHHIIFVSLKLFFYCHMQNWKDSVSISKMWRNWLLTVGVLSGIGSLAIASKSPLGYTSNGTCKFLTYGESTYLYSAASDSLTLNRQRIFGSAALE